MTSTPSPLQQQRRVFVTTRWSVIIAACQPDDPLARRALNTLCELYWMPIYHFVRRRGFRPEEAQDLTQSFFLKFLEKDLVNRADRERGRFRSFLLASLTHFLADEWDKQRAEKRKHPQPPSWNYEDAESAFTPELADRMTPERFFEKQWALALLKQCLNRIEQEYRDQGQESWFAKTKFVLGGEKDSLPYETLARDLGTSLGALKVAIHRLRKRYREILREEIGDTVSSPEEVDEELRHLIRVLGDS